MEDLGPADVRVLLQAEEELGQVLLMSQCFTLARDMIAKKLVKGKDKKDMGMSQKQGLEKRLDKKKAAIKKLAKKLMPKVKKANRDRVKGNKGK